jgi:hypothetical protein
VEQISPRNQASLGTQRVTPHHRVIPIPAPSPSQHHPRSSRQKHPNGHSGRSKPTLFLAQSRNLSPLFFALPSTAFVSVRCDSRCRKKRRTRTTEVSGFYCASQARDANVSDEPSENQHVARIPQITVSLKSGEIACEECRREAESHCFLVDDGFSRARF